MTVKHGGLGRNLSALLGQSTLQASMTLNTHHKVLNCAINSLIPGRYQPRRVFDEASLAELAESIRKQGVLQPLVVREINTGQYEIIAGERRWRAAQLAGLNTVPALLHDVDDETALALALVENIQREDLSAVEQARAMQRLVEEFELTHQHIATLLSKSRASVSNHLRLLHLNPNVLELLEQGAIDMGHARCLLALTTEEQLSVAQKVVLQKLSVREVEELVARFKSKKISRQSSKPVYPLHVKSKLDAMTTHLNTTVTLKANDAGHGTLVIHYSNWSVLDDIMTQILE